MLHKQIGWHKIYLQDLFISFIYLHLLHYYQNIIHACLIKYLFLNDPLDILLPHDVHTLRVFLFIVLNTFKHVAVNFVSEFLYRLVVAVSSITSTLYILAPAQCFSIFNITAGVQCEMRSQLRENNIMLTMSYN